MINTKKFFPGVLIFNLLSEFNGMCTIWSSGQTEIYVLFCEFVAPQEDKFGYYFQSGACLGAIETHVLLSFLWSIFCKWPVINVTLQN